MDVGIVNANEMLHIDNVENDIKTLGNKRISFSFQLTRMVAIIPAAWCSRIWQ